MQHAIERVERPGESQEALDGKKSGFINASMFAVQTKVHAVASGICVNANHVQ